MQLTFDAADRLVELVQARRGPVAPEDAAHVLFALERAPAALARSLLEDVVEGDARLAWLGARVGLTDPPHAEVHDRGRRARRLRPRDHRPLREPLPHLRDRRGSGARPRDRGDLRDARQPGLGAPVVHRGSHRDPRLRPAERPRAPSWPSAASSPSPATRPSERTTRASTWRSSSTRSSGSRAGASRRRSSTPSGSHAGFSSKRSERFSLASLAHFFGTSTSPCHRALPDALATAEILVSLLGLAQERGARTLSDVLELAAPRARKLHSKRSLIAGSADRPGRLPLPRQERPRPLRRKGA